MNKNAETINSQIAALKYDPKQILAFEGNMVSNVRPKEGQMKDSEYIVVTREVYNIQKAIDLAVPCSNNALTYPGALLLANSYLVDGKPQALGAQPGRNVLSVDLPGLTRRLRWPQQHDLRKCQERAEPDTEHMAGQLFKRLQCACHHDIHLIPAPR